MIILINFCILSPTQFKKIISNVVFKTFFYFICKCMLSRYMSSYTSFRKAITQLIRIQRILKIWDGRRNLLIR